MKLKDVLDAIGETENKKYIVHKKVLPNSTFKAYAEFTLTLYVVENRKSTPIVDVSSSFKMDDERALMNLELELLKKLWSLTHINLQKNSLG